MAEPSGPFGSMPFTACCSARVGNFACILSKLVCQVKDNTVEHFQVGLKLGFRLEDD